MKEADYLRDIKKLLLIIVVPFIFYLLSVLSMIFVPLFFGFFISLLYMPLIRWFKRKKIPAFLSIATVVVTLLGGLFIAYELIVLAVNEITGANDNFYAQLSQKINTLIKPIVEFAEIEPKSGQSYIEALARNSNLSSGIFGGVSETFGFTRRFIVMTLMTLFFTVLLLAGSVNMQHFMDKAIFNKPYTSVKTFLRIESDVKKFIIVKFLVSLLTGVSFGIAAYIFGVKFPLFWGLFAFAANFIQLVGSIISVVVLGLFTMVTFDLSTSILFFILILAGIQVFFGAVIEPILMGHSFKINIITILVMLSLWGFIWGIPGLILAIPITTVLKKIMEQFKESKVIAELMG